SLAFDVRLQGRLMLRATAALLPAVIPGILTERTASTVMWIAALVCSGVVYALMLLVTRVIRREDLELIFLVLRRKSD
ncbi:MAG: hypothetical protein ABIK37_07025, partial [candidate division WOR-3 bacterium]